MVHDFNYQKYLNNPSKRLRDIARTITFVPGATNCLKLLTDFLRKRLHIAVVLDEYQGVAGLIGLEDLLETLLGTEIVDEKDQYVDLQDIARKRETQKKNVLIF